MVSGSIAQGSLRGDSMEQALLVSFIDWELSLGNKMGSIQSRPQRTLEIRWQVDVSFLGLRNGILVLTVRG